MQVGDAEGSKCSAVVDSFPELIKKKVVQGTCGWTDSTLISCNRFYPVSARITNEKLHHYSRGGGFGCVEVDSSTYAIPSAKIVEGWVSSTPPGFLFHFKAFSPLCFQAIDLNKYPRAVQQQCSGISGALRVTDLPASAQDLLWTHFNASLSPAHKAGKMGCVMFQFHFEFSPSIPDHRKYLFYCCERLDRRCRVAFDFRNRAWLSDENVAETVRYIRGLRPNGVALVSSDDIESEFYGRSQALSSRAKLNILLTSESCPEFAYVRVHRRTGGQRVLSATEISDWSQRICSLYHNKNGLENIFEGPLFVLWGTDHEDQGIQNAKNLLTALPAHHRLDWKAHTKGLIGGVLSAFQNMKRKAESNFAQQGNSSIEQNSGTPPAIDGIVSKQCVTGVKRTRGDALGTEKNIINKGSGLIQYFKNRKQPELAALLMNATLKKVVLQSPSSESVQVIVGELLNESLSVFTWPSAIVLACYIMSNAESFKDKELLEIGCGTALPSLVACALGCKEVTITDRPERDVLSMLEGIVKLNNFGNCKIEAMDWSGSVHCARFIDIVLGSDVLYSTEDFDSVLGLVSSLIDINPNLIFLSTYQERSSKRTLVPYLDKYHLWAESLSLDSFFCDDADIAKTADVTSVEAMDGMSTCTCSIAEEVKEFCGSRRFPSATDAASLQFGEARIYMEPTDVFLIKIRRKEL